MVNVPVFCSPLRRRCASPRRRGLRGAGWRDVQGGAQHGHGGGCLHQDAVVAVPAEGGVWFIGDGFLNPFMLILGCVWFIKDGLLVYDWGWLPDGLPLGLPVYHIMV